MSRPTHSASSHVPRRPRCQPQPQPHPACLCTNASLPPQPALRLAARCAAATRRSAAHACDNAALLSTLLRDVVSTLDADARTFWCQMMDTLSVRVATGDVQYSVSVAPHLLWTAEHVYALHGHLLAAASEQQPPRCDRCAACLLSAPAPPDDVHFRSVAPPSQLPSSAFDTRMEFSWVDDDDEDDDTSAHALPIASFEAYICDVLDDQGKNEFVRERFYGGAPLNSRYLLSQFGASLGMTQTSSDFCSQPHYWQDHPFADDDFSDSDCISGMSDVESLNRSDNGAS